MIDNKEVVKLVNELFHFQVNGWEQMANNLVLTYSITFSKRHELHLLSSLGNDLSEAQKTFEHWEKILHNQVKIIQVSLPNFHLKHIEKISEK